MNKLLDFIDDSFEILQINLALYIQSQQKSSHTIGFRVSHDCAVII
jgi:hypothetical protein